ncbi:centromere protein L [Brachionichthys hirsutus]|uniref:centromere protein L n=1 Tax=Brachionichthys hirsutus TaxID=412623 RepID=UPI003604E66F
METRRSSVTRTPGDGAAVRRRSRSAGYQLLYRSTVGAASQLCATPALTARRLDASRRAPRSRNITEKVNEEHLTVLVKKEWHLSYVTPLYQFRHAHLKSYSRRLSAFIAAGKQDGLLVALEGGQSSFGVSLSAVQGMAEADSDAEMVLIQIHSTPQFAGQDEPQKSLWSGWLTCINGNPDYLCSIPDNFVCLPLFGCHGPESLTAAVKAWFQTTFDCCFGQLEVSQTSLQWLLALWTNCHAETSIQHLKMVWTIPVALPLQVTYAVDPRDAWELWRSIRKGQQEDTGENIDLEEVTSFVQGLKSHFYRHFKLDLSAGILSQVSTGLGSAKDSGRIKFSSSRYMTTTMMLLTECALLKMPI